jgi:hypothetical protein
MPTAGPPLGTWWCSLIGRRADAGPPLPRYRWCWVNELRRGVRISTRSELDGELVDPVATSPPTNHRLGEVRRRRILRSARDGPGSPAGAPVRKRCDGEHHPHNRLHDQQGKLDQEHDGPVGQAPGLRGLGVRQRPDAARHVGRRVDGRSPQRQIVHQRAHAKARRPRQHGARHDPATTVRVLRPGSHRRPWRPALGHARGAGPAELVRLHVDRDEPGLSEAIREGGRVDRVVGVALVERVQPVVRDGVGNGECTAGT